MPSGQPTKYREEFNNQAYKLALLGATDAEMAIFFDVKEQTLNNWKKQFPEFFESLKKGKGIADGNIVESLYKSAIGYEHIDTDIRMYKGKIKKTRVIRYYPPNATSIIFWLKNRQPKQWRDKQPGEYPDTSIGNVTDEQYTKLLNAVKSNAATPNTGK